MSEDLPWFQCYPGAALASCSDMDAETFGHYWRLLLFMYQRGGYAPADETKLRHILNCSVRKARAIRDLLISEGRIYQEGDQLTKERVKKAIEKVTKTPRKRSENDPKTPRKQTENSRKSLKSNETGQTDKEKEKDIPLKSPKNDFEIFWKEYPDKTNNSKLKARDAWNKLEPDEQATAIAALPAYRAFLGKRDAPSCAHAATWLNQRRFETFEVSKVVEMKPVELTDTAEHRFLAQCRDDGAAGWQRWARGGGFEVVKTGSDTVCVVSGPLHEFEDMGKATAKRLGVLIWNEAFYKKRLEKTA